MKSPLTLLPFLCGYDVLQDRLGYSGIHKTFFNIWKDAYSAKRLTMVGNHAWELFSFLFFKKMINFELYGGKKLSVLLHLYGVGL